MKIISLSAILLLCCCQSRDDSKVSELDTVEPREEFATFIEAYGSATFTSRRGAMQGMDSDSKIAFLPHGKVTLTEFGLGPQYYAGTYSIDANGAIELVLPDYHASWPKMKLRLSGQEPLLFRADGLTSFEMGDRAAATEASDMPSFWPFALIHHPDRMVVGSVVELVADYIGDGERVVFISSPHPDQRMAHPASIEFLMENRIVYRESGRQAAEFSGSYSVNEEGDIKVEFKNYPGEVPLLVWYLHDGNFLGSSTGLFGRAFSTEDSSKLVKAMPFEWQGPKPN